MRYLIIGNSAAAIGCVEGIRRADRDGEILLIASEPHHSYSRPLISYLLCGKTDEARMRYRPADFYEKNKVATMLGRSAASLDPAAKRVVLDDGTAVEYDRLLVATGSSPALPPIPGLEGVANRVTFTTLDDARVLQDLVTAETRVLILGAGLIGLKCAEGLAARTGRITVVDLADHVLPSILDGDAARLIEAHLEAKGLTLVLGDGVASFAGDRAILGSGKALDFDVLVVAVGVRPNAALVKEAGGRVNRGIVTDSRGMTSLPDVYAAGDCTESQDISSGESKVLALLPNAYLQGECAGVNMAGGERDYDKAIPMNAIGFFGLHMITAGSYRGEVIERRDEAGLRRLYREDNRLKGYVLIGDVSRAGIYTALIREQTPLDTIDFELIAEKPQLMAFSKTDRARKLGGVRV